MKTPQRTRNPARATTGTCRLIPACNLPLPAALDAGEALLSITPEKGDPTNYLVLRLADKHGRTVGFRLTRLADFIVNRKVYDIGVSEPWGWSCDCPDAEFRPSPEGCKHVRSLRAALAKAGITVSAPKPATGQPVIVNAEEPMARVLLGGEIHRQEMAARVVNPVCFECRKPYAECDCTI